MMKQQIAEYNQLALLFRKWKSSVKGRDWNDMEWYIFKGVPLNLHHFLQRAKETNDWTEE